MATSGIEALVLCSLDDSNNSSSDTDTDSGGDYVGSMSSPTKQQKLPPPPLPPPQQQQQRRRKKQKGTAVATPTLSATTEAQTATRTRSGRNVRRARRMDEGTDDEGGGGAEEDNADHAFRSARRRSPPRKRATLGVTASQPATPVRPPHRTHSGGGGTAHRSLSPTKARSASFNAALDLCADGGGGGGAAVTEPLTVEVFGRTVDLADLQQKQPQELTLYNLVQAWVEGGVQVYDSYGRRMKPPQAQPRPVAAAVFQRLSKQPPLQQLSTEHYPDESLFERWKRLGKERRQQQSLLV